MKCIYLIHTGVQLPSPARSSASPGQMILWLSCTPRALAGPSPASFHFLRGFVWVVVFFNPALPSPAPAQHSHGSDIIIYWFE